MQASQSSFLANIHVDPIYQPAAPWLISVSPLLTRTIPPLSPSSPPFLQPNPLSQASDRSAMSTIASARPLLDRGLEKLDPRRKVEHLTTSVAHSSMMQFGRRSNPFKSTEIRIIAPTDLVLKSFYNPVGSHFARPCLTQSYSGASTVSRSSSGSSASSSQSSAAYAGSEQARAFKLPGLRRKPVPSYALEVEEVKPTAPEKDVVEEAQLTASPIDIPSNAEASPKEEEVEGCLLQLDTRPPKFR